MSALRQAAQQALEAMDWLQHHLTQHHGCLHMDPSSSGIPAWLKKTEAALRAALEKPEQPVAWMCPDDPERETAFSRKAGHCEDCGKQRVPLFTAPPQRNPHEFIGLDLKEMDEIIDGNMKITDSRLRDAVYAVVIDTVTTLMEKNSG